MALPVRPVLDVQPNSHRVRPIQRARTSAAVAAMSGPQFRRPAISPRDALAAFDHERLLILIIAADVLAGRIPSIEDLARVADAGARIQRLYRLVK